MTVDPSSSSDKPAAALDVSNEIAPGGVISAVGTDLARRYRPRTAALLLQEIGRFEQHLVVRRRTALGEIDELDLRSFLEAPVPDRAEGLRPPASGTVKNRRWALRLLFEQLRGLIDDYDDDPVALVALPRRGYMPARALTFAEVQTCRGVTLGSVRAWRLSVLWALLETGATTAEVAAVTPGHVDLESGRIWLSGGPATDPRWGHMTAWGLRQLDRHVDRLLRPADRRSLVSTAKSHAGTHVYCSAGASEILRRAGLGGDLRVRPASVTAWAGRRIFAETGSIELTALRMGRRSLDLTAALIDHRWPWSAGFD